MRDKKLVLLYTLSDKDRNEENDNNKSHDIAAHFQNSTKDSE